MAVLTLFSTSLSYAETGDSDTPEDLAMRTKDAKAVADIRAHLEATYLGGSGVSADQNEGMRAYINWLMSPLENLVNEKSMTSNLRFKPIGGPSGSGKTKVGREFAQMAIKAGLLTEKRWHYQQGEEDQNMELSKIEDLALPEQQLKEYGSTNRYSHVRARHLATYAVVQFDEASHFGLPPKDLEEAYQLELGKLIAKVKAKGEKVAGYTTQGAPPPAPDQAHFMKSVEGSTSGEKVLDQKAWAMALAEHDSARLEWELKNSIQQYSHDESVERTVTRLKNKYERMRQERKEITRLMKMIWQAASGGKYMATAERAESAEHKEILNASNKAMTDFRAKYIHQPLFKNIFERFRQINKTDAEIKDINTKIEQIENHADELESKMKEHQQTKQAEIDAISKAGLRKISDFQGFDQRSIEAWMRDKKMVDEVGRVDGRFAANPELVERMIREISEKPDFYRTYDLGYKPSADPENPEVPKGLLATITGSGPSAEDLRIRELSKRLRDNVLTHYRKELDDAMSGKKEALSAEVKKLEAEIAALRAQPTPLLFKIKVLEAEKEKILKPVKAYGLTAKEIEQEDRTKSREGLIQEYAELLRAHNERTAAAASTASARFEINKFVSSIDEDLLESKFPEFYKRLKDLEINIDKYIKDLKATDDVMIKFNQLMRMDPEFARELVFDAVVKKGYQSETIELGNINVAMMMNYRPAEQEVNKVLQVKRANRQIMGFDELAGLYKEHVPPDWAEHFFKEHFPTLFADLMNGSEGNPQAVWRRLFGDTGAFFFHPMNTRQMANAVETTMQAKMRAWQKSLQTKGLDVKVDLFIHQNVPAVFVRDELNAELGNNVVLETVREAMNGLINKLNVMALESGGKPFHVKLALVNEGMNGGLQNLTLRFLPPDFDTPDGSKILKDTDQVSFGRDSTIATWSHTFKPSASLTADANLTPRMRPVAATIDTKKDGAPKTKQEAEEQRAQKAAAAEADRLAREKAKADKEVAKGIVKERIARGVDQEIAQAKLALATERAELLASVEKAKAEAVAAHIAAEQQAAANAEAARVEAAKVAEADRQKRWGEVVASRNIATKICLAAWAKMSGADVTKIPDSFR